MPTQTIREKIKKIKNFQRKGQYNRYVYKKGVPLPRPALFSILTIEKNII